MNEALQKEKNETPQEKECKCCADAALPLSSLHTARPRRWAGRYACLPRQLKQAFAPIVQPHLGRLQNSEVMQVFAYVPQIGFLTLKCRNGEVWASFISDLEYAKQLLQGLRKYTAAVRHRTVLKNLQGGMWVFQPAVSILPLPLKVFPPTNLLREQQLGFRRSPPWRDNSLNFNFFDECEQFVKPSSRWLTPSIPCAVRAPTFALPLAER